MSGQKTALRKKRQVSVLSSEAPRRYNISDDAHGDRRSIVTFRTQDPSYYRSIPLVNTPVIRAKNNESARTSSPQLPRDALPQRLERLASTAQHRSIHEFDPVALRSPPSISSRRSVPIASVTLAPSPRNPIDESMEVTNRGIPQRHSMYENSIISDFPQTDRPVVPRHKNVLRNEDYVAQINEDLLEQPKAPMTFSQAYNAINSISASGFDVSLNRLDSGAQSMDSMDQNALDFESDESVLQQHKIINVEEEFEDRIRQQDMWLDVMHMEKLNLENRMRQALRHRQELEDQLKYMRQNTESHVRNSQNWGLQRTTSYSPQTCHVLEQIQPNQRSSPSAHFQRRASRWCVSPIERFSGVSERTTHPVRYCNEPYLIGSPPGDGSELYYLEDERADTPERMTSPNYHFRENQRTTKKYHPKYLSEDRIPSNSSPHGSLAASVEAPMHNMIRRACSPKKLLSEHHKVDSFPSGIDEPSLKFEELATSANAFHQKINLTSRDVESYYHFNLDKTPPTTQYVSETHHLSSLTEPIDPELAEICARQVPQPQADCRHNGHLRGPRIADSVCSMPVHLEESTDSEAVTTPDLDERRSSALESRASVNGTLNAEPKNQLTDAKHMKGKVLISDDQTELNRMSRSPMTKSLSQIDAISVTRVSKNERRQCSENSIHGISAQSKYELFNLKSTTPANEKFTPPIPVVTVTHEPSKMEQARLLSYETTKVGVNGNPIEQAVFDVREKVRFICLGPVEDPPLTGQRSMEHPITSNRPEMKTYHSSSWIAICTGETTVSVYDFKTRSKLVTFRDHERYSNSPVITTIPFALASQSVGSPESTRSKDMKSQCASGFLCVVQQDGQMTLYNIAANQTAGRLYVRRSVIHALPLPVVQTDLSSPGHSILIIDQYGAILLCHWTIFPIPNSNATPSSACWDGQVHDLGTNIFDQLDREPRLPPSYVCCVCPCRDTDPYPRSESPRRIPSPSNSGPVNYFYLAVASLKKVDRVKPITLHLCCWVSIRQQLRTIFNVSKQLHIDPNSALIGITYTEIAGAAALCVCLSSDAFWFSLKSLDIVSTLKFPSCAQPVNYLSQMWGHSYPASISSTPQNERLWVAAKFGRILEITAFESQRRRDIAVGTDKGEIHMICLPKLYHICEVPRCELGFISPEDLVHHLVRDHYLSSSAIFEIGGFQCNWPCCDFSLACSKRPIQIEILEEHARQHLSVS
ncbi:unnamed protein product [Dicrocoelium dendriticum]|nr:unnamed protein product [Dicrocoelium dendriticum]